jgi:hypothetical protein
MADVRDMMFGIECDPDRERVAEDRTKPNLAPWHGMRQIRFSPAGTDNSLKEQTLEDGGIFEYSNQRSILEQKP